MRFAGWHILHSPLALAAPRVLARSVPITDLLHRHHTPRGYDMQDYNTPDHRIADTDHGTLVFAGSTPLVIADWEITETAPDSDGRIYKSVEGWRANSAGTGKMGDPYVKPVDAGRAQLIRSELRGQQPIAHRDVHVDYESVSQPYPNTWDHPGYLVTVCWMDRRIDASGQPIPEDEIGRTEWTNPATGEAFDLTERYVPKGEFYYDDPQHPYFTWQHFDRWRGGVPLLHPFWCNSKSPAHDSKRITDGEWVKADDAPRWSERRAALNAVED